MCQLSKGTSKQQTLSLVPPTCSSSSSLSTSTSEDHPVISFLVFSLRVITVNWSDFTATPGNSCIISDCKKGGHSCTMHSTVPRGLSLINDLTAGVSSSLVGGVGCDAVVEGREGEKPVAPGRGNWG